MPTTMGEYLVGAYLQLIEGCDVVSYGLREPGGGLKGLNELDVLGVHYESSTAYLCEVTTHITGMLYKNNQETVRRINKKHENQRTYARKYLPSFRHVGFSFWSPRVPKGYITDHLAELGELALVINGEYARRIAELQSKAAEFTHDTGNPAFRVLQILEHLRE